MSFGRCGVIATKRMQCASPLDPSAVAMGPNSPSFSTDLSASVPLSLLLPPPTPWYSWYFPPVTTWYLPKVRWADLEPGLLRKLGNGSYGQVGTPALLGVVIVLSFLRNHAQE
jgi:hypothetical protein